MIICPNCQHQEMSGAIYCSNCGAQLVETPISTRKIQPDEALPKANGPSGAGSPELPGKTPVRISLNLIDSELILPLADRNEFTLGRSAEGQPIVPDVDLLPYNAYANGVSRLHALLKIVNGQVILIDLGSSNGTYLNGARLSPYVETLAAHGDIVYLGKLKIQLLIE